MADVIARKGRRWPKVLLAVSLALNLLVIGLLVGAAFHGHSRYRAAHSARSMLQDTGILPFYDALPREVRRRTGQALHQHPDMARPDSIRISRELADMVAAIRAEPFDAEGLAAVFSAQGQRVSARIAAGQAVLIEQVSALSTGERQAFARRLEERVNDPHRRGH